MASIPSAEVLKGTSQALTAIAGDLGKSDLDTLCWAAAPAIPTTEARRVRARVDGGLELGPGGRVIAYIAAMQKKS